MVKKIDGSFVNITFDGDPKDAKGVRYTRSGIRRIVQPSLSNGVRVRTTFGVIGTISGYKEGERSMKLTWAEADLGEKKKASLTMEIDKSAIREILPEPVN